MYLLLFFKSSTGFGFVLINTLGNGQREVKLGQAAGSNVMCDVYYVYENINLEFSVRTCVCVEAKKKSMYRLDPQRMFL